MSAGAKKRVAKRAKKKRYAIRTDDMGHPIERPVFNPGDDVTAFIRARHAYNDRVAHIANEAFDAAFRKAMR